MRTATAATSPPFEKLDDYYLHTTDELVELRDRYLGLIPALERRGHYSLCGVLERNIVDLDRELSRRWDAGENVPHQLKVVQGGLKT